MAAVPRSVWAGAIFAIIGGIGLTEARQYRLGTAVHMGPGYFPVCLSVLLLGLGASAVIVGWTKRHPDTVPIHWEMRDLTLLTAGVVLFAALIDRAGLLAAAAGLILLSCLMRIGRRPVEVALLWGLLSGFCGIIFIEIFGLPFRWL